MDQLVLAMLLLCGRSDTEQAEACRDYMVNCAVDSKGEITEEKIEECAKVVNP